MELTAKQQIFCDEYLCDLNATQAAIRAGYSKKTAEWIGPQLLGKTHVAAVIAERMKARQERTRITQDYVLQMIKETVERCRQICPVLDRQGNPVMVETPDGTLAPAFIFDAKNVLKGCELLGKHVGLFTEKVKHQFTNEKGEPITEINITVKAVKPGDDEGKWQA